MTFISNGPTETDLIDDLNERFRNAVAAGEKSERDKVRVQSDGFLQLMNLGGLTKTGQDADGKPIFEASDAIKSLLAERGIKNKVGAWNHCAQLVLGYTIENIPDKVAKKKARNFVDRCAKLFEGLHYFASIDPATFPSEQGRLADWIEANGGLDGVVAKHREALGGDEEAEEAEAPDLEQFNEAIETNGITATPSSPISPYLALSLTRMDENGDLKIVPLTSVPASVMVQLSPYLPAMDAMLPDEVRYWAQVTTLCMMFDRQDSDEAARPDEEQHAGNSKLPSMPIVMLWDRNNMTVAPSGALAPSYVVNVYNGLLLACQKDNPLSYLRSISQDLCRV